MVQLSFFRFLLNLYPFSQFLASFKGRLIRKRHSYEDFALSVFQSFSLMNVRTLEKFQGSHEKVNIWLKRKPLIFCWKVFVDLFRASRLSLPEGFFPDSFFILPPYGKGMDDYDSWMYRGPLGNSFELQIFQIIKTTSSYLDWFLLNFWSILDHIWLVVDLISDFRFNLIHYKSIFCWLFLYFVIYIFFCSVLVQFWFILWPFFATIAITNSSQEIIRDMCFRSLERFKVITVQMHTLIKWS